MPAIPLFNRTWVNQYDITSNDPVTIEASKYKINTDFWILMQVFSLGLIKSSISVLVENHLHVIE